MLPPHSPKGIFVYKRYKEVATDLLYSSYKCNFIIYSVFIT